MEHGKDFVMMSVITNLSVPSSVLRKRHNAICYHRVREAQTAGIIRVGWIEGKHNIADLFTKTTLATNQKHYTITGIFNNNAELEKVVECISICR